MGSSGDVIGMVENTALQMLIPNLIPNLQTLIPNLLQSLALGTSRLEKRKFVLVQNPKSDPPCWKGEKSWDNSINPFVFGTKGVGTGKEKGMERKRKRKRG